MGALSFAKRALVSLVLLTGFFASMVAIGVTVYLVTGSRRVGGLGLWAIIYSLLLAKRTRVKVRVGSTTLSLIALVLGFATPFAFVREVSLGDSLRAIIMASALFSLSHAFQSLSPLYLLSVFMAGIALGLWKVMAKGLLAPTALHAGWNLTLTHLKSFEGNIEGIIASSIILILTLVLKLTSSRGPLFLRGSSPSS